MGTPSLQAVAGQGSAPPVQLPLPLLRALVERVEYGFTEAGLAQARALGPVAYVQSQLQAQAIDDSALDALLAPLGSLPLDVEAIEATYGFGPSKSIPFNEIKHAALLRAVFSQRQLEQRLVEFWTDHFSIQMGKVTVKYLKLVDDREVVRAYALTSFPEILGASARSAAMLAYLDNEANTKEGPNENYARELMELHTVGVESGYFQGTVIQAARCLTAWRFVEKGQPGYGQFLFVPEEHEDGDKFVLGFTIPAGGGDADVPMLLDILANQENTPRHVGGKLASWLLGPEPSDELLDAVAATWTATGGDVKAVVAEILSPRWLLAADPVQNRKLRRPFHFVAGLLRTLGAQVAHPASYVDPAPLHAELTALGQEPFEWVPPNGYPDGPEAWAAGLQPRWSFASRLLAGQIEGVTLDPAALTARFAAQPAASPGEAISLLLTGGALPPSDVASLDAYAADHPPVDWPALAELIALGASTPGYQLF